MDFADQLILELDAAPEWPLPRERAAIDQTLQGRAWRRSDRDMIAAMAGFDADRQIYVDPLAKRIAFGFADFLFGEDTELTATAESGQGELDQFAEVNGLQARLHRACRISVSEGEVWWKFHTNAGVAPTPLIRFCSRRDLVPLMDGDIVLAAAFVTERGREAPTEAEQDAGIDTIVFRHAEVHTDGRVVNALYRGTLETLGRRVELTARPETAMLAETLVHGLPMWAGRIVNDLDDVDDLGISDLECVTDLLVALCEAVTISIENARLTGLDRIAVAGKLKLADGNFDASMQVLEFDGELSTLGEGQTLPIHAIEKRYDAEPLWVQIRNLVHTILSRVGLVVQIIGQDEGGKAETGTAIRLRFLPTSQASKGKRREYGSALPRIAGLSLAITALDPSLGGFGRAVDGDPLAELPAVEFGNPIPRDDHEETNDLAVAVTGEIMSRETAVREQHPDWSDEQVADELRRIREDLGADPVVDDPEPDPSVPDPLPDPEQDPPA